MNLHALKPGKKFSPRSVFEVNDLCGNNIAQMELMPKVMIGPIIKEIRNHHPLSLVKISQYFKKAYDIFLNEEPDGLSLNSYIENVHKVTGIPFKSVKNSIKELANNLLSLPELILSEIPKGASFIEYDNLHSVGVFWTPKGKILSIIAAGNNPLTHKAWLEALASGYKIVVKPSQKEPFTPYRLILSLLKAGLPEDYVLFIPGNHDVVESIISESDFSLVYGNESSVNQYKNNEKVITRGPGYSKIYWDTMFEENYNNQIKEMIIDSVLSDGGMKCFNTSGIVYKKSNQLHMESIFETILSKTCKGFLDDETDLPLFTKDSAVSISKYLESILSNKDIIRVDNGNKEFFIDFGNGVCAMKPLIIKVKNFTDLLLKFELPFPAFWAYEFEGAIDFSILKNSLTLTIFSDNMSIKESALHDSTIKKVITKPSCPSKSDIMIPHEGYLLSKLFDVKAVF